MFNCLSNLTTRNDNKWLYFQQNNESLWHDLAIKTHKIYPLYTPNQTLIRGKDLSDHLYDTWVFFAEPMNNIRLAGCSYCHWTKWGTKKQAQKSKLAAQALHKWPDSICICPERDPLSSVATELRRMKPKLRISSCEHLNCKRNWIPRLTGC